MTTDPKNYTEFWDFYVQEHSKPLTRMLHFAGTTLGIILLVFFIARGQWYFFPVFFVVGYGFAPQRAVLCALGPADIPAHPYAQTAAE